MFLSSILYRQGYESSYETSPAIYKTIWIKTLNLFKLQNFLDVCPPIHTRHTWESLRTIQYCLFSSPICCIYFPNLEHREDNFPRINLYLNQNSPFFSHDANTRVHRHAATFLVSPQPLLRDAAAVLHRSSGFPCLKATYRNTAKGNPSNTLQ